MNVGEHPVLRTLRRKSGSDLCSCRFPAKALHCCRVGENFNLFGLIDQGERFTSGWLENRGYFPAFVGMSCSFGVRDPHSMAASLATMRGKEQAL